MFQDTTETCTICGGDGRIGSAMGATKTCPACHGSGRRAEDTGHRDVTKTKPSHYGPVATAGAKQAVVAKPTSPRTAEGVRLAAEIRDSKLISDEIKTKLAREIIEHEISHGTCTKTFAKKVRKQLRPALS